jgi:hypothetical protein
MNQLEQFVQGNFSQFQVYLLPLRGLANLIHGAMKALLSGLGLKKAAAYFTLCKSIVEMIATFTYFHSAIFFCLRHKDLI